MTNLKILNDNETRQIRDVHLHRLSELFSGRHGQYAFVLCGVIGNGKSDLYTEPEKWVAQALDDLASKAEALCDTNVFRPLSVNPCAGMPADKIMDITGGQRTVIVGDIREPMQMRQPKTTGPTGSAHTGASRRSQDKD